MTPVTALGRTRLLWDGPCSVHVVTSICAFFGVESIDHISEVVLSARAAKRYSLRMASSQLGRKNIPIKLNIGAAADFDLSTLRRTPSCYCSG